MITTIAILAFLFLTKFSGVCQYPKLKPEFLKYEPFIWPSEIPEDCPFKQSEVFNAIKFLGIKSGCHYDDTCYP